MKEEYTNLDNGVFVNEVDWVLHVTYNKFSQDDFVQYVSNQTMEILQSKDTSPEQKWKLLRALYLEKINGATTIIMIDFILDIQLLKKLKKR
jgi:hypothetical protein